MFENGYIEKLINDGNVVPYYQGIHDSNTKQAYKYEVLGRLIKDDIFVNPGDFLPIIKQNESLYHDFTMQIIQKSIKYAKEKGINISINMSVQDLTNQATILKFLDVIKQENAGLLVTIEITEEESIQNFEEVNQFIDRVKNEGCKISLDDFGSGYSNFNYLIDMPFDYLKLDGSLIKKMHESAKARYTVQKIIELAHDFGAEVIAEYVENEKYYDYVKKAGCNYCQGFHFSKPILSID